MRSQPGWFPVPACRSCRPKLRPTRLILRPLHRSAEPRGCKRGRRSSSEVFVLLLIPAGSLVFQRSLAMAKRDVIVIGSSAGGVQACCALLKELPADLPASILIVQHTGEVSVLSHVLGRCDSMPVITAVDGEAITHSRVYVAPGDHHLLIDDGHVKLS